MNLYLELVPKARKRAFVGNLVEELYRNRLFSPDFRQSVSTKIDDKVGDGRFWDTLHLFSSSRHIPGEGGNSRRPKRAQSSKSRLTIRLGHTLGGVVLLLAFAVAASEPNQLTDAEKQAGWKLLFDGQTAKGWRGYRLTAMPTKGWRVEEGTLKKVGGERGGDIITEETFNDFDLTWEWRISPAGNNGLKYLVTEERPSAPGQEYQMIDDARNPDAKVGPHRATSSFYDVLPPSADKPLKPVGEWNQSRVQIQGNHVEHWLNGKKVLEYELGSDALKAAVAKSKFKSAPGFGEKLKGHIMLTDHGDECSFRNIKIRVLPAK